MQLIDFVIYGSVGICLAITLANWFIWRDIKNPAVLHSLLWLTIVSLHTFAPHGLNPLNLGIYCIIFSSMFLFSCGTVLGFNLAGKRTPVSVSGKLSPSQKILNLYRYTALIGVPFFIMKALELASHATTDNFLIDLRMSLTDEHYPQSYGIAAYFLPIAFSYFFIGLLDKNTSLASKKTLFSLIICLVYAVLSTGRTYLFFLFIPAFFILSLTRVGFFTPGKILIFFAVLLLAFVIIGSLLGKLGGGGGDALSVFWVYLLGGITAFQELFLSNIYFEQGLNTFRTIYAILAALGFDVEVKQLVQEYVYIPGPTNVYSVFGPYYLDFGIYFALGVQFFLGIIHAVLYRFAKQQEPRAILLYSLSIYPLFMQWFEDQYFSLMSMWVFFGILLLLPFIKITLPFRRYYSC